jgi:CheY-like chemotaxis protein
MCNRLRSQAQALERIEEMAFDADKDVQAKEHLQKLGMDVVIVKPLDHAELGQTFRNVMKSTASHQSPALH